MAIRVEHQPVGMIGVASYAAAERGLDLCCPGDEKGACA